VSEISLDGGRVLGYERWGDVDGKPLFFLHGTPGCRLSRHPDATLWPALHLHVITIDRPGYGCSTPLPGRKVSHAADDVAAVANALSIERFLVAGASGGGPHALACAANLGERVLACAPVACAAPVIERELGGLLRLNRESYRVLSEEGREGMVDFLGRLRERILADPIATLQVQLADAAPADIEWERRKDVQTVRREAVLEALRPGVGGWVDDAVSLFGEDWGINLSDVTCPVRFWHSDDDRNGPLSAIRRVVEQVPDATLHVWAGEGHSAPSRYQGDVLRDLMQAATDTRL
jgi:pimeloyl-ACP methyl ester carboxylesterase